MTSAWTTDGQVARIPRSRRCEVPMNFSALALGATRTELTEPRANKRVGLAQSRRLHAAPRGQGVSSELVIVEGADHADPEFDEQPVHDVTLAFLAKALGTGGPQPASAPRPLPAEQG